MNGRDPPSSDARPSLKRSRQEELANQAEEEEGLVALVKKRRSDVKVLVSRISGLETELDAARGKLQAAESLLQAMQGPDKIGDKVKKEPHDRQQNQGEGRSVELNPGSRHQNGHGNASKTDAKANGSKAALHGRNDFSESKPRKDNLGARPSSEPDRRDRKTFEQTPGVEASQKPPKLPTPPLQQEHVDLIMTIKSKSKAQPLQFFAPKYSSSNHRRKMRNLVLNPSNETECATSALDGLIRFWQIQAKGMDITSKLSVDCLSPGQRHWPEDLAWHPEGHSLFAVYHADNEDSQVSIIKNDNKKRTVKFLPDKPHLKGVINGIRFMPWSSSQFVTGGSDHMVHLWREKEGEDVWKPKLLHANLHTSAVHGVAGTRHRQLVLSAGADKRVIGYDPSSNRMAFKHDLEGKAMTVLPNTVDFNLFMVQTAQPNKQLHLFDIRARSELHTLGWHQDHTDTQSSLITQSWSPDGFYTASGSADPKIVLFDIRFNGREPAQTINAHMKRVFMAVWHPTIPMLLSISSDLNIGLHKLINK